MKILFRVGLFTFLTVVTQIGGIVYLFSVMISNKLDRKLNTYLVFIGLYLMSTFIIVPMIAPIFGRERVAHSERIKPANYMTVVLNRNYVRPALNDLLAQTEKQLNQTKINIHYLDANFPFINKFPLFPHLSHNDGKKIDLSLIYQTSSGKISDKQKSVSGYGAFESPKKNERNQIEECLKNGHFQYDLAKYISFGKINDELEFSENGTRKLINSILKNNQLEKLFIEPHLKTRLGLSNSRIRYHGCWAVRHDDHIHIQLK